MSERADRADHRILKTAERNEYGCTASVRERSSGEERLIVVLEMTVLDACREVARQLDELDGEWYVETISTPDTIYRDLQGSRRSADSSKQMASPEANAFSRIARLDLLRERPAWARSDGRRRLAYGGSA